MNLADMLCYADIDQLTRIADTYRCECSSHSKNELIQTILSTVQRRDVLESRVQDISLEDLRFLNSLLFEQRAAYSLEELAARAQLPAPEPALQASEPPQLQKPDGRGKRPKRAEPPPPEPENSARSAIARFKRFGWLFNGFSHQTRFLYHVPDDVKRRLCEALDRKFRASLDVRGEPSVYRDERGLAEDDVRALLLFVRDNDVPLTADSVMYKRQLQQALELMNVAETAPGRSAWRFGYGRRYRDYPDRFSLLYDYCCFENWLQELPDRLALTAEGERRASGSERVDPSALYRFWLKLYKTPVPNLISLVQWVSRLAGEWTTVESIERILLPLVKPFYYDTPQDVLRKRVLGSMMHLGLLMWGETEGGEPVVRMTPQGRRMVTGNEVRFEDRLQWSGV
ncbi:hypothetical protein [Cohnella thermotolerans]|uniref:hypothetical protein n=1 Tax=Cohnella thermotolerans TaxID=329858 RepID=UPI00047D8B57|nr:hypothetical protein [Cohnella thermotolerans]